MTKKEFAKRLFAVVLTFMLTISMSGYTFVEAFTEDGEIPQNEETEAVADEAEPAAEAQEAVNEEAAPAEQTNDGAADADADDALAPAEPEAINADAANDGDTAPETTLPKIEVKAAGDENFITVVWKEPVLDNTAIAYYKVFLDENTEGCRVEAGSERKCVFGNAGGGVHKVTVKAYKVNSDGAADQPSEDVAVAEGSAKDIKAVIRNKLASGGTAAGNLGLSLRPMLGEGNGGYAVAQGAATDGTYAYYMLASSSNQKGRVLKVNMSNSAEYYRGDVLGIHHANGMTYDSKRNRLVAVGYGTWRNQLSFIDPNSLQLTAQQNVSYPYAISGVTESAKENGFGAIAYVKEYDVFVARSRGRNNGIGDVNFNNDIWIINAENLNVIGHVYTQVSKKYPETYQSMDADAKYVYYLLSPGSGQNKNIILALDWNSENLLPVLNGEKEFVEYTWNANNDNSGTPDAVLTIPITHESEGLFHATDSNGNAQFYVSEYHGRWIYKTVKKKYKVKVKWKKVRKWYNKKTHKWQKKKPKKKYRGKSKKVWKYKTKTKTKKVTVKDYYARDNYVYYIGSF